MIKAFFKAPSRPRRVVHWLLGIPVTESRSSHVAARNPGRMPADSSRARLMRKAPLCNGDVCSAVRVFGVTLPLCARCLSLTAGLILGWALQLPHLPIWPVMVGPVIVDGAAHYLNIKESSNNRRFLTGIPGGVGIWLLAMGIAPLCRGVETCL